VESLVGMELKDDSKHRVFEPLKQIKFDKGELLFYSLKKNNIEKETLQMSGIEGAKKEGFYVVLKYSEKVKCYKNDNSKRQDLKEETFCDSIIKEFIQLEEACNYFNNLRNMILA
jgi:hypothetical protein